MSSWVLYRGEFRVPMKSILVGTDTGCTKRQTDYFWLYYVDDNCSDLCLFYSVFIYLPLVLLLYYYHHQQQGVYTRISYYYDWIIDTMCELNSEESGLPAGVTCSGSSTSDSGSVSSSNGGGSSSSSSSGPSSGGPPAYYLDDTTTGGGIIVSVDETSFFEDPLGWLEQLFFP